MKRKDIGGPSNLWWTLDYKHPFTCLFIYPSFICWTSLLYVGSGDADMNVKVVPTFRGSACGLDRCLGLNSDYKSNTQDAYFLHSTLVLFSGKPVCWGGWGHTQGMCLWHIWLNFASSIRLTVAEEPQSGQEQKEVELMNAEFLGQAELP